MLRRSPRVLALWAAAAAVALGTGAVVTHDLVALHRRATSLGPERPALVAAHDLPMGTVLTAADVRVRRVYASQLPPRVLADRADAVGRVVGAPVLADGFVTSRNLAARGRHGLDGALPPGTRAVRVVAVDSVRPRPGAAVDVYATYDPGSSVAPGRLGGATLVVASGALVLATDDSSGRVTGHTGVGVTLLVDPATARGLAEAATHARLTLALVPPEDASPA